MVHTVEDKKIHKKKKKHSRKVETSSSSSSSDESPPRRKRKDAVKNSKKKQNRDVGDNSPPSFTKNLTKVRDDRRHSEAVKTKKRRKRETAPSSTSDENTPPRSKDVERRASKMDGKHSRHDRESQDTSRQHRKEDRGHGRLGDDKRKERNETKHGPSGGKESRRTEKREESPPPVKIKKEEDFDRRQEELRRKRRDEERRNQSRHTHNVRVKQELESDDDRRRRHNREGQQGGRHRNRDDIQRERRENDARRAEAWQRREREGGQNAEALLADSEEPKEKEKPNLGLSGALTEDTNTFRGVVIKYSEPPEARIPTKKWRLYPFKGDEALKVLHLHRQSAFLLGKLRRIADIPIDHPSCSKQHAVLQFRVVEEEREDGRKKRITKPYIIDLDSANGTFVNNQKIEPRRYVELKEKDVIKFAYSSREYVLIHDKSDTTGVDVSEEESDND